MAKYRNFKTRGNYPVPFCIRQEHCQNKDKPDGCDKCIRYSRYKEKGKE